MSYGGLMDGGAFRPDPMSGMYRPGSTDNMIVIFNRQSVLNEARSTAEGRPVYDAVDFVRIQQPGERDYQHRPATPADQMRWPRQWQAYQSANQDTPDGTPLDVLFPANPEIVSTLRSLSILTAEHLAEVGDNALGRIGMGARGWQQRAKEFLEHARTQAPLHQAKKMIEERDEKITLLEGRLAAMERRLAELDDDPPRRRRRNSEQE